ncbi:SHOCT domain-containing protein [Luteolibacter sp. AS25]|uniref:SHOCT domain-containing protein n=1 Tax=Luteolibacter sp. AS25 TaxID=3135776 RepID=UPI00398AA7F3
MQQLTPVGQNIVNDISSRYNLSFDSTVNMLAAVNRGGGSMAQFSCPELGSGQWMRGGMTMVSDMFNHGLKNTVNNLCGELSSALANNQMFPPAKSGGSGNNWWPGNLGSPSSSGSQNNIRYAFFPQAQRLVVERNGDVTVFNTLNHNISGVSQQQGGNTSLTFSSQFGTISTLNLPLVEGPGLLPANKPDSNNFAEPQNYAPASNQQQQSSSNGQQSQSSGFPSSSNQSFSQPSQQSSQKSGSNSSDIMEMLGNLGKLRDSGILTDQEFNNKKADLLNRL